LQQEGDKLRFVPCIPEEWESFKVHYRYKNTVYNIVVTNKKSAEEMTVTVDGVVQEDRMISLTDDEVEHNVQVEISTNQLKKLSKQLKTDSIEFS
jgi:cellobiose phosphorylase